MRRSEGWPLALFFALLVLAVAGLAVAGAYGGRIVDSLIVIVLGLAVLAGRKGWADRRARYERPTLVDPAIKRRLIEIGGLVGGSLLVVVGVVNVARELLG